MKSGEPEQIVGHWGRAGFGSVVGSSFKVGAIKEYGNVGEIFGGGEAIAWERGIEIAGGQETIEAVAAFTVGGGIEPDRAAGGIESAAPCGLGISHAAFGGIGGSGRRARADEDAVADTVAPEDAGPVALPGLSGIVGIGHVVDESAARFAGVNGPGGAHLAQVGEAGGALGGSADFGEDGKQQRQQ